MRALRRKLARGALRATFYVAVAGIVMVIFLPVYFLLSLSLMSDTETYNQWPLPMVPSFSAEFLLEKTDKGYAVAVCGGASAEPFRLFEGRDAARMAGFVTRKTNCRLTEDALRRHIAAIGERESVRFRLPKALWANYVTFFKVTRDAWPSVLRSLKTALATVIISLIVGGSAGYAFARYVFRGKGLLRISVLFVRIFPGVAIAIPMAVILSGIGLYDKPMGLALVYAVGQIALTVWISASVFMGIPVELEEAAQVFGASRAGAFLHVTLPMAVPGLAACAMYAFVGSWNETIQAIVLTQANPTFPVVVYQTLVGSEGMVNLVTAGGVAMAVPAVVFTLIIRRHLLRMWGGASSWRP
ncbi:carbohydrate ABC transporter permease [Verrucomicrobiota bacterium]